MRRNAHPRDLQAASSSRFFRFGRAADGSYRFDRDALLPQFTTIGEGEIGGKARGLLFAMDALRGGARLTTYQHLLCFPDSTVLTSEVFDGFMEENHLRKDVQAGCEGTIDLDELERRILAATFPTAWANRLAAFLEREKRPLVVRSSSVMEDDPEHSFAGIYLSVFLANQGPLEARTAELVAAVRRVYASTFAENARAYRKRHALDWRKEKMAILIQNMIGSSYPGELFYPLISGVAFSRNYYPWTPRLHPEDGVVRLVVGTGTRAVGRGYARVFSPRLPGLRPEGSDVRTIVRYSQETVDVLNLASGALEERKLHELRNPLLAMICSRVDDNGDLREIPASGPLQGERLIASFYRLVETPAVLPLTPMIRELLASLAELLELPVDIEFAVDFSGPEAVAADSPLFYLLQVRPLGNRPEHRRIHLPNLRKEELLLECRQVLGNGKLEGIRHLVLVPSHTYRWDKAHDIARSIGRINRELAEQDEPYILMGPGRWASTNPRLGVPARYSEIAGAAVIVEMSTEAFAPELSHGTHFYADMVGSGILYLPFYEEQGDRLDRALLERQEVVHQDEFVTHYRIAQGLSVYVDGERQRGVIALRRRGRSRRVRRPSPR